MRNFVAAMLIGGAMLAAPSAQAQTNSARYVGTWAFQTNAYGQDQGAARALSGSAVIRRSGGGYDVRLVAHEIEIGPDGSGTILSAVRERCRGALEGAQLTITCELAEEVPNYQPDNFVLQAGEDGQLVGVMSSVTSGEVVFTRVN